MTYHYWTENLLLETLGIWVLLGIITCTQVNHWKHRNNNFIPSYCVYFLSFLHHLSIHCLHISLSPFLFYHLQFLIFNYLLFLWMFNRIDCLATLLRTYFPLWNSLKILWYCLDSPKIRNKSRLIELLEFILSFKYNQLIQVLGFVETLDWWCFWGSNNVWMIAVWLWGNKVRIVVIIDEG